MVYGRGTKIFLALAFLVGMLPGLQAATLTAASGNQADVQAACNSAQTGDTVMIPAGTFHWTSYVYWEALPNVSVFGAGDLTKLGGGDATVLVDDSTGGRPLLSMITNPTGTFRLAGITLQGGTGDIKEHGLVGIGGQCKQMRVDHIHINTFSYQDPIALASKAMMFAGWINGVADHIVVERGTIFFAANGYGGVATGGSDQSWAEPTGFGTSNFVFVEDSQFIGRRSLTRGGGGGTLSDGNEGSRFVLRFNTTSDAGVGQTHPTGGSGRGRGTRAHEVYGNVNVPGPDFNPLVDQPQYTFSWISSGTAMVWGNTDQGVNTDFIHLDSMRKNNATYTQSPTPDGWGYSGTEFTGVGSAWDGNLDPVSGYPCLDQPGQGQSDLLAGDFPNAINTKTGSISWPHQALEPIREWMNSFTAVRGWGNDTSKIYALAAGSENRLLENRDYYSATPNFDGTAGIGVGPRSARPTTCTPGVAYWSTDQGGNWNTTNNTLNDGTLDVCTAPNVWTNNFYTPYTYPHPLTQTSSNPVNHPPVIDSVATAAPNPATASQNVSFSVSASDPDGDALSYAWTFGDGSTAVGAGTSPTHTYATAGFYAVQVTVSDSRGGTAVSNLTLAVNSIGDSQAPVVAITQPLDGALVARGTRVTIAAQASDNVGVTQVQFFVNGALKASDTTAPYSFSWKTPIKRGVVSRLTAKAKDAAGNVGASATITVTTK